MNGKRPSSGVADLLEDGRVAGRTAAAARSSSTHGTPRMSAIVRGSRRSWLSTRARDGERDARAHAPCLHEAQERVVEVVLAGLRRAARSASPAASSRPSRSRSSASQRSASSMTWLETSSVAPRSASRWKSSQRSRRRTGSSPTVGSSRTSSSGWPSSAAASETRARWPPGEPRDDAVRRARRATTSSSTRSTVVRPAAPRTRAKKREVLAHGEVAVDRRRLRHVADARGAAPATPAGCAEHRRPSPPATICTPTIARISVDLPLPLGPSSPVTEPAATSQLSPAARLRHRERPEI